MTENKANGSLEVLYNMGEHEHFRVKSSTGSRPHEIKSLAVQCQGLLARGRYGNVYKVYIENRKETAAMKEMELDEAWEVPRELEILRKLEHPNIVQLKYFFYRNDGTSLSLLLELMPATLMELSLEYKELDEPFPMLDLKLYAWQTLRGLGHLHMQDICHRDVKLGNVLVDRRSRVAKLCDFGVSKVLVEGAKNKQDRGARDYRAPELILGNKIYDCSVDLWSFGCVLAELLIGVRIFRVQQKYKQMADIIKVLGNPTEEEAKAMKVPDNYELPNVRKRKWEKVFSRRLVGSDESPPPAAGVDLCAEFLAYAPDDRIRPYEALTHEFFDELRDPELELPDQQPLPDLFDIPDEELDFENELYDQIVPSHGRNEQSAQLHAEIEEEERKKKEEQEEEARRRAAECSDSDESSDSEDYDGDEDDSTSDSECSSVSESSEVKRVQFSDEQAQQQQEEQTSPADAITHAVNDLKVTDSYEHDSIASNHMEVEYSYEQERKNHEDYGFEPEQVYEQENIQTHGFADNNDDDKPYEIPNAFSACPFDED